MTYHDTSELRKTMDEAVDKANQITNRMKKDHGHSNGYLVAEYTHTKPKDSIWFDGEVCLYWTQDDFALRSGDKVILGVAPIFIEKDEQWQLRMFKELKANLMAIRSGYLPQ